MSSSSTSSVGNLDLLLDAATLLSTGEAGGEPGEAVAHGLDEHAASERNAGEDVSYAWSEKNGQNRTVIEARINMSELEAAARPNMKAEYNKSKATRHGAGRFSDDLRSRRSFTNTCSAKIEDEMKRTTSDVFTGKTNPVSLKRDVSEVAGNVGGDNAHKCKHHFSYTTDCVMPGCTTHVKVTITHVDASGDVDEHFLLVAAVTGTCTHVYDAPLYGLHKPGDAARASIAASKETASSLALQLDNENDPAQSVTVDQVAAERERVAKEQAREVDAAVTALVKSLDLRSSIIKFDATLRKRRSLESSIQSNMRHGIAAAQLEPRPLITLALPDPQNIPSTATTSPTNTSHKLDYNAIVRVNNLYMDTTGAKTAKRLENDELAFDTSIAVQEVIDCQDSNILRSPPLLLSSSFTTKSAHGQDFATMIQSTLVHYDIVDHPPVILIDHDSALVDGVVQATAAVRGTTAKDHYVLRWRLVQLCRSAVRSEDGSSATSSFSVHERGNMRVLANRLFSEPSIGHCSNHTAGKVKVWSRDNNLTSEQRSLLMYIMRFLVTTSSIQDAIAANAHSLVLFNASTVDAAAALAATELHKLITRTKYEGKNYFGDGEAFESTTDETASSAAPNAEWDADAPSLDDLVAALSTGEINVYFQPNVSKYIQIHLHKLLSINPRVRHLVFCVCASINPEHKRANDYATMVQKTSTALIELEFKQSAKATINQSSTKAKIDLVALFNQRLERLDKQHRVFVQFANDVGAIHNQLKNFDFERRAPSERKQLVSAMSKVIVKERNAFLTVDSAKKVKAINWNRGRLKGHQAESKFGAAQAKARGGPIAPSFAGGHADAEQALDSLALQANPVSEALLSTTWSACVATLKTRFDFSLLPEETLRNLDPGTRKTLYSKLAQELQAALHSRFEVVDVAMRLADGTVTTTKCVATQPVSGIDRRGMTCATVAGTVVLANSACPPGECALVDLVRDMYGRHRPEGYMPFDEFNPLLHQLLSIGYANDQLIGLPGNLMITRDASEFLESVLFHIGSPHFRIASHSVVTCRDCGASTTHSPTDVSLRVPLPRDRLIASASARVGGDAARREDVVLSLASLLADTTNCSDLRRGVCASCQLPITADQACRAGHATGFYAAAKVFEGESTEMYDAYLAVAVNHGVAEATRLPSVQKRFGKDIAMIPKESLDSTKLHFVESLFEAVTVVVSAPQEMLIRFGRQDNDGQRHTYVVSEIDELQMFTIDKDGANPQRVHYVFQSSVFHDGAHYVACTVPGGAVPPLHPSHRYRFVVNDRVVASFDTLDKALDNLKASGYRLTSLLMRRVDTMAPPMAATPDVVTALTSRLSRLLSPSDARLTDAQKAASKAGREAKERLRQLDLTAVRIVPMPQPSVASGDDVGAAAAGASASTTEAETPGDPAKKKRRPTSVDEQESVFRSFTSGANERRASLTLERVRETIDALRSTSVRLRDLPTDKPGRPQENEATVRELINALSCSRNDLRALVGDAAHGGVVWRQRIVGQRVHDFIARVDDSDDEDVVDDEDDEARTRLGGGGGGGVGAREIGGAGGATSDDNEDDADDASAFFSLNELPTDDNGDDDDDDKEEDDDDGTSDEDSSDIVMGVGAAAVRVGGTTRAPAALVSALQRRVTRASARATVGASAKSMTSTAAMTLLAASQVSPPSKRPRSVLVSSVGDAVSKGAAATHSSGLEPEETADEAVMRLVREAAEREEAEKARQAWGEDESEKEEVCDECDEKIVGKFNYESAWRCRNFYSHTCMVINCRKCAAKLRRRDGAVCVTEEEEIATGGQRRLCVSLQRKNTNVLDTLLQKYRN